MIEAPSGAFFVYVRSMAARSIATATISFGLVTVPVRVYPATRLSAGLSFHMLHAKDKVRLKQQYVCPKDDVVVPRSEMVKGYEYRKDKYVVFTDRGAEGARRAGDQRHRDHRVPARGRGGPGLLREDVLPRPGQGRREGVLAAGGGDGGRGPRRPRAVRGPRQELPRPAARHRRPPDDAAALPLRRGARRVGGPGQHAARTARRR